MVLQTEAIKAIYDAAFAQSRWQSALDRIAEATEVKAAILYDFGSLELLEYRLNTLSSLFDQNMVSAYNELVQEGHGSGYDEEGLLAMQEYPSLRVIRDDEIYSVGAAYDQRPEIILCKEEMGLYRRKFVNLSPAASDNLGLIFLYDSGTTELDARNDQLIETLAPHVVNSIELHRLTQPLRFKYRAVLSVLDMIDLPILLFGPAGNLILRNRAADDILSDRDALWLDQQDRLITRDEDVQTRIEAGVGQMGEAAAGQSTDNSVAIEIERGANRSPLYALISPLRDAEMELERGLQGAFMTLIDPTYPARVRVDLVATAYGLTQAEERVAELVAQGMSNVEIADRLGVSAETVKTQLKAVFDKTGCRSRLAFLWRIFQFSPPVR